MPGIHDKNSNPLRPLSAAYTANFLSGTAAPEMIISSFNNDNLLKFLPSFIIIPS